MKVCWPILREFEVYSYFRLRWGKRYDCALSQPYSLEQNTFSRALQYADYCQCNNLILTSLGKTIGHDKTWHSSPRFGRRATANSEGVHWSQGWSGGTYYCSAATWNFGFQAIISELSCPPTNQDLKCETMWGNITFISDVVGHPAMSGCSSTTPCNI